jgi:hypothetical protein
VASASSTDSEAVKAAETAAKSAERTRAAECEKRGPNCRTRETEEQTKLGDLVKARGNNALTDQAAKLDAEATAIRASPDKAPAVKEANTLGWALGGILSLSAASAATAQQWLMSAIVELLIAGVLTLPELL